MTPAARRKRATPRGTKRGSTAGNAVGRRRDALVQAVVGKLEELERARRSGRLELPTGSLDVTNLEKVFYRETGHTKGALMRYYARMSPYLLPAMADRSEEHTSELQSHSFISYA